MVAENYDPGTLGRDDRSAQPLLNHARRDCHRVQSRPPAGRQREWPGGWKCGDSRSLAWMASRLRPPAFFLGLPAAAVFWTVSFSILSTFPPSLCRTWRKGSMLWGVKSTKIIRVSLCKRGRVTWLFLCNYISFSLKGSLKKGGSAVAAGSLSQQIEPYQLWLELKAQVTSMCRVQNIFLL